MCVWCHGPKPADSLQKHLGPQSLSIREKVLKTGGSSMLTMYRVNNQKAGSLRVFLVRGKEVGLKKSNQVTYEKVSLYVTSFRQNSIIAGSLDAVQGAEFRFPPPPLAVLPPEDNPWSYGASDKPEATLMQSVYFFLQCSFPTDKEPIANS